jgi:hypothetical protein
MVSHRCREGHHENRSKTKMRVLALLTVLPFVVTTPALAQNAEPNQQQSQDNAANSQTIQQQVQNNLQQAGFTDIHIMPSSFLVRAKDRAGNPVMMVINPDSVTAVTEVSGQGGLPPSAQSTVPGGSGQVTVPSGQNSGVGIPGQPGNKSGPAAKSSSATTGSGNNEGVREQDSAKIPGLPGSKSGPAVKPPSR